jgi:hypothetical protein
MHNPRVTLAGRSWWLALAVVSGVVGCGGLEDKRPAKWSFIYATIIQPQCATVNCHSEIAKAGTYDFHTREIACANWGGTTVLKGDAPGRPRMPPDAPLPAPDIELIDLWQETVPAPFNDAVPSHPTCERVAPPPESPDGAASD